MGILDKLFFRKQVTQNFITKTPESVVKEMEKDYYTKKVLQENVQVKVENIKLQKKLKEKDAKKEMEKEEKELEKEVWNKRLLDKKLEKDNSIVFRLVGAKPPVLFTKSNKPYGKFIGFYLKQQQDGTTLWYPLIKDGFKLRKINCVSLNPLDFFNSVVNIPGQLRAGKIDTTIDITKDGKPAIIKDQDIYQKLFEDKHGKDVKVFRLDELERREYEQTVFNLKEQIKGIYSQLRQANEKEVEYDQELNESELEASALEKARDLSAARITGMMDKNQAVVVEAAKANMSIQDAVLGQVLTERAFTVLMNKWDNKMEELGSKYSKEDMQLAREEVKKEFLEGIGIRKSAEGAKQVVLAGAPTEQAVKKAVEKEHEK